MTSKDLIKLLLSCSFPNFQQGFLFDLSDSFSCYSHLFTNSLQSVAFLVFGEAKAMKENLFLCLWQGIQQCQHAIPPLARLNHRQRGWIFRWEYVTKGNIITRIAR